MTPVLYGDPTLIKLCQELRSFQSEFYCEAKISAVELRAHCLSLVQSSGP